MPRLTTSQVTKQFNITRFALGRATKSGFLNPLRDNRGALTYDEAEVAAWIGRKGVRSGSDARTVSGERDAAQAHMADLMVELGETRQRLQLIEERLSGAEKLSEAHRQRADNAEARAERAEARADRAADDLRAVITAPLLVEPVMGQDRGTSCSLRSFEALTAQAGGAGDD